MEEKIYFESDGLKLCGLLEKKDTKKCIILCHGMKVGKDEKGAFPKLSKAISDKGFSVFRFDFRGHGESEGLSRDMTIPGETRDVEAAFEKMKSHGFKEFGILGASFGGGPVAYFAEKNPELKGVAFWNALIDYSEKINPTTESNKQNWGEVAFKEAEETGEFKKSENFSLGLQFFKDLKVLKPWKSVLKLKMPLLFIHGDKDVHVLYSDSVKYAKMYNAELVTIKGGVHGLRNKIEEASEAAAEFFEKVM